MCIPPFSSSQLVLLVLLQRRSRGGEDGLVLALANANANQNRTPNSTLTPDPIQNPTPSAAVAVEEMMKTLGGTRKRIHSLTETVMLTMVMVVKQGNFLDVLASLLVR
jgi:hypothetical protein